MPHSTRSMAETHQEILERARPTAELVGREAARYVHERVLIDWTDEILDKAIELYRETFPGPELPHRFWSVSIAVREIGVRAYGDQLRALANVRHRDEAA